MKQNTQKSKIAILIPRYGLVERGTENFTREFVAHLKDTFECVIFARGEKDHMIKVQCIPASHTLLQRLYKLHPRLSRILDRYHLSPDHIEMLTFSLCSMPYLLFGNYDLLFPQNGVWGALVCRLIRAVRRIPFIYRSAGGIEPMVARQKPDIYFTINPAIARWFNAHFPDLRVIFLSNGVNLDHFSLSGRQAKLDLPHPIIVTASALTPSKRIDLTIEAVGKLKKGSLLILGDGPLKNTLTQLAQDRIGKGRFLIKKVSYEELPDYYRASDVFAFSAPDELGWGLVHLEALAVGLPVVANREENLEFLMGSKALLCDVRNVSEYAYMIEKAIRTKKSLRTRVKQYSWEKTSDHYKRYLNELINHYGRVT